MFDQNCRKYYKNLQHQIDVDIVAMKVYLMKKNWNDLQFETQGVVASYVQYICGCNRATGYVSSRLFTSIHAFTSITSLACKNKPKAGDTEINYRRRSKGIRTRGPPSSSQPPLSIALIDGAMAIELTTNLSQLVLQNIIHPATHTHTFNCLPFTPRTTHYIFFCQRTTIRSRLNKVNVQLGPSKGFHFPKPPCTNLPPCLQKFSANSYMFAQNLFVWCIQLSRKGRSQLPKPR